MDKKTKNILIVISVVMILVAVIIVISKLIAPTTSTNNTNANIKDTTIDGLRISNVNLVGNELTAYVQNTTSNSISIKTITVKFIDKDNNEIDSVNAYFGGVFASNEIRNLDVKTDADLSNLSDVSYEVIRSSCVVSRNSSSFTVWQNKKYYYTGYYQCNGVTGYISSCYLNGYINGWPKGGGTVRPDLYIGTRLLSGISGYSNTYACTLSKNKVWNYGYMNIQGGYLASNTYGGGLSSTINCSCE